MPITEAPIVDERTEFVRLLVEWVKDDQGSEMYRVAYEKQVAEAAVREARHAHLSRISKLKRGHRPGSRPWQSAGFASRQAWLESLLVVPRDTPPEEE